MVKVTSPYTNQSYMMAHYAVNNTAPRPESYLTGQFPAASHGVLISFRAFWSTDYLTVHDPTLAIALTDEQADELYSELASGAESGWDFTSRFEAVPQLGNPGLHTYNIKNTIPVCLNSILCTCTSWLLHASLIFLPRQGPHAVVCPLRRIQCHICCNPSANRW